MAVILAVGRGDVAAYVNAVFTVYIVLIFVRILLSWVPALPTAGPVAGLVAFVSESTDPYLNLFRRFLPPVGGGGFALDLSPIVGVILLVLAQALLVGAIRG